MKYRTIFIKYITWYMIKKGGEDKWKRLKIFYGTLSPLLLL